MNATVAIKTISIHPDFPEKVWVIVEQPRNEPYRLSYDPISNAFTRTTCKSLLYERGFGGAYGWIGGMGAPPEPHYDVLLLTKQDPQPGDVLLGYVCGVFYRRDGDHKFVALDAELRSTVPRADLASLDKTTYDELMRLYPQVGENEGWHGAEEAFSFLKQNKPVHD
jgi:inorganic pyrophosphatase